MFVKSIILYSQTITICVLILPDIILELLSIQLLQKEIKRYELVSGFLIHAWFPSIQDASSPVQSLLKVS